MSAQLMQTIAPGWRRVATPRYKKDYKGKYVTAEDFSDVRSEFRKSPPDGAVCLVERATLRVPGRSSTCSLSGAAPIAGSPAGSAWRNRGSRMAGSCSWNRRRRRAMTTAHEIPCYPVPHYPGYCINRRGQVFGPRGMLKIDENYRCTLYRKRHPKPLYVGEIMELVGLLRSESTVEELEDQARKLAVLQEENAALHQELEEARTSLQRARKINSHFMARDKRERRKIRVSEADMAAPDAEMLPEYFGWPNDVKR